jgi:hypothetical protein
MIKSTAPLWASAVLACCYFFSSTAYAQTTNPNNCPNTYTGTVKTYGNYDSTDYSTTVICNSIELKNIIDSTIHTYTVPTDANGNPIGVYNPLTDEFTFSNNTASAVTATASFAINAALQAAGIGLEFRGMKYEWEIYKPTASSELKVTVRIKSNGVGGHSSGLIYQSTHNYTGTAFANWTAQDDGGNAKPPFAFVVEDEWTVETAVQGDTQGDGIRKVKYTFSYAPKIGHEDDFDPNYVYPGQEQEDTTSQQEEDQQTSFEEQCEINPQFSPGCADYQDPNIDDGIDDDFDPVTGILDDDDLQEELANAGLDNMISDSALQTGTNADGSLSSAIVDTGADIQDGGHGGRHDGQIDGTMPDMPEDTIAVIMIVDETGGPLNDEQLMELDEIMIDTLNDLPAGIDPTSDLVQDALQDALDEIGGSIEVIELPSIEAELIAIDEQLQELSGPDPMDTTSGGPLMHEDGQMKGPESEPLPIEVEGDISSEISESGEVAIEVDGTLSNIPDEPQMEEREEIIEIDPIDAAIDSPIEEATVVSETGTISETATVSVAKPSLSVTQKRALSVASATTAAAIEVAGQQAFASTTSGIEQSQSGSSLDAQGGSSTGSNADGTPSTGSNSGMSFGNTGSSSGIDTGGANTTSNNNNSGNFNIEQNNDTGPQTALGQSTSSTGNVEIASIIADSTISSLNQSGPTGVFESEDLGQVEKDAELALGGAVTYEETNETMFGTIVIPQLDFTVREMIDAVIRKTLVDAGMESEFLSLDEVSEEDLKAQQDLEDKLVEEAIAGSTSEDANAAYLGYNPTFRDYVVPQVYGGGVQSFYAPKTIYPNNTNYDHPNQRFFNGASDVKHRALVRMQYEN